MNIWQNATITNKGRSLLSKLIAGNTLDITRAVVGSGYVNPETLASQVSVSVPQQEMNFRTISYPETGKCALPCYLSNETLNTGYTAMQIGIYATDPDEGEILYFLVQAETGTGTPIPSKAEMPGYTATWTFYFQYGQADGVTVVVDPSNTVTTETMEAYVSSYVSEVLVDYVKESDLETTLSDYATKEYLGTAAGQQAVHGVCTLTHAKSGTVHAFTGMTGRTGLVPCQFKATDKYEAGDTATIDGTAYTITLTGADDPETDLFVSEKAVLVDVDTEAHTINFKAGGGLTGAKLALANATEDEVFQGKTFYAGDKEIKTGRALSQATTVSASNLFNGQTAYNNKGQLITGTALSQSVNVTANNIPSGVTAYNQAGQRITGNGSGVFKYKSGSCFLNGSSKSISCDFHIWMVALYGGSWLSDCVLFTGTSNSGSTTFYKAPDSDHIDQEHYQGTITVSGGNYATIWYNPGDGCSIYYYVVGV